MLFGPNPIPARRCPKSAIREDRNPDPLDGTSCEAVVAVATSSSSEESGAGHKEHTGVADMEDAGVEQQGDTSTDFVLGTRVE